jgi:hypothetical protein
MLENKKGTEAPFLIYAFSILNQLVVQLELRLVPPTAAKKGPSMSRP